MRRGTTPSITLTVDTDLTGWSVYVTLKNGASLLTLENDRLTMSYDDTKELTTIGVVLTQQETLAFGVAPAEVQVRAAHNGVAVATDIQKIDVKRILKDGVIDG